MIRHTCPREQIRSSSNSPIHQFTNSPIHQFTNSPSRQFPLTASVDHPPRFAVDAFRDVDRSVGPLGGAVGPRRCLSGAHQRIFPFDALLLYGSNLNGCGHPTWLANYVVKLPFAALAVLPRVGDAALLFQGATRGRAAAQATTWIEDVRPCWDMAETCLQVLQERRLTESRVGLAALPRLMPHAGWRTIAAGLAAADLVDAEDLVNQCRAIKSDREVEQIGRAAIVVARAMESIVRVQPSEGEWQLVARLMREARMRGAEDIRVLIARPQRENAAFRPVEDIPLSDGETVSVLLAASWEHYWSEAIRTFQVDARRFEPAWDQRIDARFQQLVATLRPGTLVREWFRRTHSGMTAAEASATATYGVAHGIGITPEEWPRLADSEPTSIAEGMCFVIRAAFEGARELVWHGDTICVQGREPPALAHHRVGRQT